MAKTAVVPPTPATYDAMVALNLPGDVFKITWYLTTGRFESSYQAAYEFCVVHENRGLTSPTDFSRLECIDLWQQAGGCEHGAHSHLIIH